ncbi:MAG: Fic family protein [Nitrospirota bacterium]
MSVERAKLTRLPISLDFSLDLMKLACKASLEVGNLNGSLKSILDSKLLINPLTAKEAEASSAIEGTQASISDYFRSELGEPVGAKDIDELINYRIAMDEGLKLLDKVPFCGRLVRNLHRVLLRNVRGQEKNCGEWRSGDVWIGPKNCKIEDAYYVAPLCTEIPDLMKNIDDYVHSNNIDPLIQVAIVHYQFEGVHPFFDGNGRIGRLIIPLVLKHKGVLDEPVLYISRFLEENRINYYAALRGVYTEGKWEEWIRFFLEAVIASARLAQSNVARLRKLYEEYQDIAKSSDLKHAQALVDLLFLNPYVTRQKLSKDLKTTHPTVKRLVDYFSSKGVLVDTDPERKRGKLYVAYNLFSVVE